MIEQTCEAAKPSTPIPAIGGVLSIVSAGISLLIVLWSVALAHNFFVFGGLMILMLISSILALIGGIFAIKRKHWTVSLLGAIASVIGFTGLLGIVATILIAMSKKEFR